eukprot:1001577-Pelagomonas_calceolata.AAC.1
MAEIATQRQPMGLFTPLCCDNVIFLQGLQITKNDPITWVITYGVMVVKTRVYAAASTRPGMCAPTGSSQT